MWPFRKDRKASSQTRSLPAVVRARYDAAQTTAENARHWAMADALSADGAASADVRKKLRERARYEVANNSYAKGIVLTIANDCIGTGPRLQLLTDDASANHDVEAAFVYAEKACNDNTWHHAALIVEKGKGFRLHVDGVTALEGATDEMGTWHLWHVPTERLGMRIGPGDGEAVVTMDDLRVYQRPLSEQEVKELATAP